jgi:hypothetical protein
VAGLLQQAADAFEAADQALADGDLAGYQREVERARDLVAQAGVLAGGGAPPEASTTTTSTTAQA